jgi:hypothetical protein
MKKTSISSMLFFVKIMSISALLTISLSSSAQSEKIHVHYAEVGEKLASLVSQDNLKESVYTLASDEFEGRETGSKGIDKAADFIKNKLISYGIQPASILDSYYQNVAFTWISWENISVQVGEERFKHLWDFISYSAQNEQLIDFKTDEVLFLAYGIDDPNYSDYKNIDVKNKVLLVYKGEPTNINGESWVSKSKKMSYWNNNLELKKQTAAKHGAKLILFIEDDLKKILTENRSRLIMPSVQLGVPKDQPTVGINSMQISTNLAKALIGKNFKKLVKTRDRIQKNGKPQSLTLKTKLQVDMKRKVDRLDGKNILAYIEGSDPILKDELLIVTAHYDHLGMKGDDIFNGADDNASGSSGILELARIFSEAKKMGLGAKRSVLFMWVTGEEKGLLGSKYYVENPVFPLEKTLANINIDMIGRIDSNYEGNPNYIYVIGADKMSTELDAINEEANQRYTKLILDKRYNDENDPNRFYYRSDHYNFVQKGIPAVFYFSGVHTDYHRPSDTADKINFEKMAPICQLAFHVAWELTNRDQRIKVDKQP